MNTHRFKTEDTPNRSAANRFSDKSRSSATANRFTGGQSVLQKKGGLEEEELLQGKFAPIQKMGKPEEEELLQGKFETLQRKPNNTGLPDTLKSGIYTEVPSRLEFSQVHYNAAKPSQLQAHAYAQGKDIHVAPGQEKHLSHEAWHVV